MSRCCRESGSRSAMPIEFCALLTVGCLIAFATAAYGDAWDNVKHCFLFNLELDACLISGVCMAGRIYSSS